MTTAPPTSTPQAARPFASGPNLGAVLPDFTLPDQHGDAVTIHEARGSERVFLVFVRGTDW